MKTHPAPGSILRGVLLAATCALLPMATIAADPKPAENPKPKQPAGVEILPPKLGVIPQIDLTPSPLTAEEKEKIDGLIKKFAEIDKPDFGLSGTMSGTGFAPHPGAGSASTMILTNHDLKTSSSLTEVVRLGPKALPALLEHLDDKTETKLAMDHKGGFGMMWYARELFYNPAVPEQEKIVQAMKGEEAGLGRKSIKQHQITVGDVCFVALGQITGERYQAVRYQPSANIVINSPTQDPELAKAVRALLPLGKDPERALLDHLLTNYSTEGSFNGRSLDGWRRGSFLQVAAVRRLLFYFPKATAPLIAERLKKFDVALPKNDPDADKWMRREVANGADTEAFIKAVAWSDEPAIREALTGIFKRTNDPELLVAAAPGLGKENTALLRERIEAQLAKLPDDEEGPYGDAFNLLSILGTQIGADAKPAFQAYAKKGGLLRKTTLCLVFGNLRADWSVDLLKPLLRDKQEFSHGNYAPDPTVPKKVIQLRICDAAAQVICTVRPALKFELTGPRKNLDEQITKMLYELLPADGPIKPKK